MSFESEVQERLGITFKNQVLLKQAFVHRSYLNENASEHLESNERLEFFGDAVLSYVVADRLYRDCPTCQEGELTEWRGFLVRRDSLALFARRMGLGQYLLLGRGEDQAGGRERALNLASLFEAVVGAITMDRGLTVAKKFIFQAIGPEMDLRGKPTPIDPKSRLQELVQSKWQRAPVYRTVHEEGPEHRKIFTVEVSIQTTRLGSGTGHSKQEAERQSAIAAIAAMTVPPAEPADEQESPEAETADVET
jgi:ribonuclease-3